MPKFLSKTTPSLSLVDGVTEETTFSRLANKIPQEKPVKQLWLALHFPKLAVEMRHAQMPDHGQCLVAVERIRGRSIVRTASALAEAKGISPGMSLNAAYSLYPDLAVLVFDAAKQQRYLEKLAHWAGQFSSKISIADTETILLEAMGSVRLFGGLDAFIAQCSEQFSQHWPHQHCMALTPSPAASALLAGVCGESTVVVKYEALKSTLADIPIKHLPLAVKKKQQLYRIGLRRLRDLWRLPRQDLARRYGRDLLVYMDSLTGVSYTPLNYFESPETFSVSFPLSDGLSNETRDEQLIIRVVKHLLQRLEQFLMQRDASISEYYVQLQHGKKKPSNFHVGFRKPGRDLSRLLDVFVERLKKQPVQYKVTAIKLWINHLHKPNTRNSVLPFSWEFLQSQGDSDYEISELLELFQARLGHQSVATIQAVPDHRPELAYRYEQKGRSETKPCWQQRPLWLLPEPHPLTQQNKKPCYGGVLTLVNGPERIESGWWSSDEVRRDYYLAVTVNGQRLWVFQELTAPYKWYLHGFFA